MQTERLYQEDSFLLTCTAVVEDCQPDGKGGCWVELNRTVIFPEGGGQPSDRGTIGGVAVSAAKDEGERVLHHCAAPLPVGAQVEVKLDAPRRLEMMQQHTGEHILAGAAYRLYGANNVGFHLNETSLMVDFDQSLDGEQLAELERTANQMVWENHPITARIITEEEYQSIPMRKKADHLTGDIRLVEVEGVDAATCCGTHCQTSAQVGLIKILTSERYKGGTRVEFACGVRALQDYGEKNETVNALSHRFSVKTHQVLEAVDKQEGEIVRLREQLAARTSQLLHRIADELLAHAAEVGGVKLLFTVQRGLQAGDAKELAGLLGGPGRIAAVILPQGERLLYQFTCGKESALSMKDLCGMAGELLGGKGGGGATQAQGSAPLSNGWEEQWSKLEKWTAEALQ